MALFPYLFAQEGWHTSTFIAKRLNRPTRTVQHWCRTGFFTRRGCIVILTPDTASVAKRAKYWIYIPPMTKDAMLSKVPLDIPLPYTLPLAGTKLCEA